MPDGKPHPWSARSLPAEATEGVGVVLAGTAPDSTVLPDHWRLPLQLPGGKALPNHVLPGPMEGITAGSFCTVMGRRGLVRCWITPFIRISTGTPRRARLKERIAELTATGRPVVAQLMGTDAAKISAAAERLCDLGVAGIDLNCGCPSPTVVGHGAGGARLRNPQWIHDTLAQLRRSCPSCGVSVKLRAGFADPREMNDILPAVRAAAPDFVVVHFRTVAELYAEVSDGWDRLARARELLPDVKLIGSGDLFSAADALALHRRAGVDGVAPARGVLRNPWLLRDIEAACRGEAIPPHPPRAKIEFLAELASDAEIRGVQRTGFVLNLAANMFGENHPLFRRLTACRDLAEIGGALARAGAQQTGPDGRPTPDTCPLPE